MRDLRKSLHSHIRHYFHYRLKLRPPVFHLRGRHATATTIAPNYGEFLMEEAVLLQHLGKDALGKWPKPASLHMLMLKAVREHTHDLPIDRKHSVSLRYTGLYRAELSILAPGSNSSLLAINDAAGWQPDIQKNLADWFKIRIKHQGLQLQRIACYLNAWADFHPNRLQGFAWLLPLDILAARFFQADIGRDDKSLARTAAAIAEAAPSDLSASIPFAGLNDLPWLLSQEESRRFFQSLEALAKRSRLAVLTKDKVHACAIWRSLLGDRFPMAGVKKRKFESGPSGLPYKRPYPDTVFTNTLLFGV